MATLTSQLIVRLDDQFTSPSRTIAASAKSLTATLAGLARAGRGGGSVLGAKLAADLRSAEGAVSRLQRAADRLTLGPALRQASAGVRAQAGDVNRLAAAYDRVSASSRRAPASPRPTGGVGVAADLRSIEGALSRLNRAGDRLNLAPALRQAGAAAREQVGDVNRLAAAYDRVSASSRRAPASPRPTGGVGVAADLRSIEGALSRLNRAGDRLNLAPALRQAGAAAREQVGDVNRLAAAYKRAAAAARSVRPPASPGGGDPGMRRSPRGRDGAGGSAAPPSGLLRGPRTPHYPPLPGGSPPLMMPGGAVARGWLREGFDSAATIPQVQAQMRMRGETEEKITSATRLAHDLTGQVKQFTAAQHLQSIYQSLSVFGDMDRAMQVAPKIQRYNALIEGLQDQFKTLKPFSGGTLTKDFARIFDSLGVTENPKLMDDIGQSIIKGIEASAGDITPSDYLLSLKYARTAKYGYNSDFLQNYFPGIIGDSKVRGGGAGSAGTGLSGLYDQFHDLKATNPAKEEMIKLGLIEGEFERDSRGKISGRGTANVKDAATLRGNPYLWATNTLLPLIEARRGKLTGDDKEDVGKVAEETGRITSNRVVKDMLSSLILQRDERNRDARISRGMPGLEGLDILNRDAPVTALQQLTAATTDFLASVTSDAVQPAMTGMKALADGLRSFSTWRNENPTAGGAASAGIVGGAGALSALFGRWWLQKVGGLFGGGGGGAGATSAGLAAGEGAAIGGSAASAVTAGSAGASGAAAAGAGGAAGAAGAGAAAAARAGVTGAGLAGALRVLARGAVLPSLLSTVADLIDTSVKQYGAREASGPGSKRHGRAIRKDADERYGKMSGKTPAGTPSASAGGEAGSGAGTFGAAAAEVRSAPAPAPPGAPTLPPARPADPGATSPISPGAGAAVIDKVETQAESAGAKIVEALSVTATPKVETAAIADAEAKAKAAGSALAAALDATYRPNVDTSQLQAALGLAQQLTAEFAKAGSKLASIRSEAGTALRAAASAGSTTGGEARTGKVKQALSGAFADA